MSKFAARLPARFLQRPIAHRGLHDRSRGIIENSPSAFREAIAHRYGIECDLQPCRGDDPIVFHDHDLKRLTGTKGSIVDITRENISALRLTGSNETPLSFDSLLQMVDARVPLLVEIKYQDPTLGEEENVRFLENIADISKCYTGEIAFMSFSPFIIAKMRELCPIAALGLVTDNFLKADWRGIPRARARALNEFEAVPDLDFDFISHDVRDLNLPSVARYKKPILTWTVKSQSAENKAREIVDNITFEGYIPQISNDLKT